MKKLLILFSVLMLTVGIAAQDPGAENQQGDKKSAEEIADESEAKWHNPDYKPYVESFDQLIKLSDAFAENKLRLALSNYQTGRSIIQKMRESVQRFREEAAEAKHLNEKWYWQTLDRKAREERQIAEMKRKAKLKAVTYFTRSISHLDEIQNRKVRESQKFKKLLADVYRDWVIQQYDLKNLPQCIDILERYINLDPEYEKEISPHKYLASCYGFRENVLIKYDAGTEEEKIFLKKKKNQHLLRAAELKYKKNSPEYEKILSEVNRDEIIAISQ